MVLHRIGAAGEGTVRFHRSDLGRCAVSGSSRALPLVCLPVEVASTVPDGPVELLLETAISEGSGSWAVVGDSSGRARAAFLCPARSFRPDSRENADAVGVAVIQGEGRRGVVGNATMVRLWRKCGQVPLSLSGGVEFVLSVCAVSFERHSRGLGNGDSS